MEDNLEGKHQYLLHHRTLIKSFGFAWDGIVHTLKYNQNMRIHLVIALIVIVASIFFKVNNFEKGIIGIAILLVLAAEMINTSIEEMTDLITKEHRQEAKVAKDVAAGMVLVVSLGSIIIGVLIFTPYLLKFFGF